MATEMFTSELLEPSRSVIERFIGGTGNVTIKGVFCVHCGQLLFNGGGLDFVDVGGHPVHRAKALDAGRGKVKCGYCGGVFDCAGFRQ